MLARALAPAKVTLFGEHAVVYGYPALVMSIDLFTEVIVDHPLKDAVIIESEFPGGRITAELGLNGEGETALPYVSTSVKKVWALMGSALPVRIGIKSHIPFGSGLGSSASVAVGTLAAYSAAYGKLLDIADLAALGREVEVSVQGRASPMDTLAVSVGGVLEVNASFEGGFSSIGRLDGPRFLLAYTKKEMETGAAVEFVRRRREQMGRRFDDLMGAIGSLADEAVRAIRKGDWVSLGSLMSENEAYLEQLGVVNERSRALIRTALEHGALGAKISGGGFGGSVVVLCGEKMDALSNSLKEVAESVYSVRGAGGVSVSRPGDQPA